MDFIFFNPLYLLAPPFLIIISIPLSIFAIFTSTVAFTLLLIRVSIVYFELGLALLQSAVFVEQRSKPTLRIQTQQPLQASHRRQSSASNSSVQDFAIARKHRGPTKSESFASLLGAGAQGTTRDYEGIGGWRDAGEDPAEEALWISMNSRLELPAVAPERQRRHQRSLTGGSQRWSGVWSPEATRRSPVQSRARTPSLTDISMTAKEEEYFGIQPHANAVNESSANKAMPKKRSTGISTAGDEKKKGAVTKSDGRRKSLSGSSNSSTNSGKLSKSAIKQMFRG